MTKIIGSVLCDMLLMLTIVRAKGQISYLRISENNENDKTNTERKKSQQ